LFEFPGAAPSQGLRRSFQFQKLAPILKENHMANEEPNEKPTQEATELNESDLTSTVGGAVNRIAMLDGIKGESSDDKHKG
jgi:hypothetical protein